MMRTVTLTRGLPASGKTTWAKALMKDNPGMYKNICKDDLRNMLDFGRYGKYDEKFIRKMRNLMIIHALDIGKHVIVSDTNLSDDNLRSIKAALKDAGMSSIPIKIKDFTDVPLEVCIQRDAARPNPVGTKVITDMYRRYIYPTKGTKHPVFNLADMNSDLDSAVIVDLDGTYAIHDGRDPYDASSCGTDRLNWFLHNVIESLQDKGVKVIIVSGRMDDYKEETLRWMKNNNITFDELFMRPSGCYDADTKIKEHIYRTQIDGKYTVIGVFDDRPSVVRMWKSLGLFVFDCYQDINRPEF